MAMIPLEVMRRRLTLADYQALPDDADYEIFDGVLYVSPRARYGHQAIAHQFAVLITVHATGRGRVIPDADLIFDKQGHYFSPDVMYFSNEKFAQTSPTEWNSVVPDLIVEVLSPDDPRRDLIVKRDVYARLRLTHYWIADPGGRLVRELVLGPDGQYQERIVRAPEVFRPAIFPDLEIDLTQVFGYNPREAS